MNVSLVILNTSAPTCDQEQASVASETTRPTYICQKKAWRYQTSLKIDSCLAPSVDVNTSLLKVIIIA